MLPVREQSADMTTPNSDLAQLRCNSAQGPRILLEKMIPPPPPRLPRQNKARPRVLCGHCGGEIDNLGAGHSTRCPHCTRAISVPGHVRVECERCGHAMHVRPREIGTERLCAKCAQQLSIADVVLTPRRRHGARRVRYHGRHRHGHAYADAAGAVLILGLTLVISILALTIL
jgi:hypothetical protein